MLLEQRPRVLEALPSEPRWRLPRPSVGCCRSGCHDQSTADHGTGLRASANPRGTGGHDFQYQWSVSPTVVSAVTAGTIVSTGVTFTPSLASAITGARLLKCAASLRGHGHGRSRRGGRATIPEVRLRCSTPRSASGSRSWMGRPFRRRRSYLPSADGRGDDRGRGARGRDDAAIRPHRFAGGCGHHRGRHHQCRDPASSAHNHDRSRHRHWRDVYDDAAGVRALAGGGGAGSHDWQ